MQPQNNIDPISRFRVLGDHVRQRWKALNFSTDAFANLACEALQELPTAPEEALEAIVLGAVGGAWVPPAHPFSDLSIRLYTANEFFIELLVWLDSTTAIHGHAFTGAFRVISGGSIQSTYTFDRVESVTRQLEVGRVHFEHAEWLQAGAVQPIEPRARFFHSIFHLGQPSLTLVVRTHTDPWFLPQFQLQRPYIAIASELLGDSRVLLCARCIESLRLLDERRARLFLQDCIATLDIATAFALCTKLSWWGYVVDDEVVAVLAARHHSRAELIREVLVAQRESDRTQTMRAQCRDPETKFFLALLTAIPSRRQIEALVRHHLEVDDVDKYLANALLSLMESGVVPFRIADESALEVVTVLLRRNSEQAFLRGVSSIYGADAVAAQKEVLSKAYACIRDTPMLRHLLK
jgi:diphthamide synthase (EF-2-diphthine--ammonia ligase)